jgi:chromate transporter
MSNQLHFLLVAHPVYVTKQPQCILHGIAGAIIAANANVNGLTGIMACWVGLFAPGILLIYALLPWWARFRQLDIYRRYVACFSCSAT